MYLAGCHVVAQTQGYHLICIWGSEGKFQGRGGVLNLVFCRTGMPFLCAVCMQAMTHSVANVPSQYTVKSVVVGAGFWETIGNEKWGELGRWPYSR